jgi:hypothetical protein
VGGLAVADVNGDGIADVVAGLASRFVDVRGRVVVWFGGKDALRAERVATFLEPAIGNGSHFGSFGYAIAAVGDVNRDGFADVAVGAPGAGPCTAPPEAEDPLWSAGRVFLLAGARGGFAPNPLGSLDGVRRGGSLGSSFQGAGDIDGDGAPEVVIDGDGDGPKVCSGSSPSLLPSSVPLPRRDEHWIFHCHSSGFSLASSDDPQPFSERLITGDLNRDGRADLIASFRFPGLGVWMRALAWGDVDGDGLLDLAAGHEDYGRGRLLFYRAAAGRGISEPPTAKLVGPSGAVQGAAFTPARTGFGHVIAVTDVDRDGFADIVVGAPVENKIYVYAGSRAGPTQPARQVLTGEPNRWAPSEMVAGDFDADGYGDLAVTGACYSDACDKGSETSLTVYRGSAAGLVDTPALVVPLVP